MVLMIRYDSYTNYQNHCSDIDNNFFVISVSLLIPCLFRPALPLSTCICTDTSLPLTARTYTLHRA